MTDLEYSPGTPWTKAHDPKGNIEKINIAVATGADNAVATGANTLKTAMLTNATAGDGASLILAEPTSGGTSKVTIQAPALAADRVITVPDADVDLGDIATAVGDIATLVDEVDTGVVGQARLIFTDQPTATDTISIGADDYEFDGVGGNINVAIGLDADETRATLIAAINAQGTESVWAEVDSVVPTTIVIYNADTPGGAPIIGTQNIVLVEAITAAADIWDQANLNTTGRARFGVRCSGITVIDAVNILPSIHMTLPFVPLELEWYAKDTGGVILGHTTATFDIVAGQIVLTPDVGMTPLAVDDVVYWTARG